jgi:2-hydroxy-3-keto-5-methylthiopentenyl-1-phosphate phosphatase
MRIFCDFDGTISLTDTSNMIFARCADPSWEVVEERWVAGEIDAATCMVAQVELIEAPLSAINAHLDQVELRAGFTALLSWCRVRDIPFTIVSDGVDHFIHRILKRHGIDDVTVIANRLVAASNNRWTLEHPWRQSDCAGRSGVCKCAIVAAEKNDGTTAFVGDGRSDFCVATRPDVLFATGRLQDFCTERAMSFLPFDSFADVQTVLEALEDDPRERSDRPSIQIADPQEFAS